MAEAPSARQAWTPPLTRADGDALIDSGEAILKGLLESDFESTLVAGSLDGPFAPLFRAGREDQAHECLTRHGIRLCEAPEGRAIEIAADEAAGGARAVALVSAESLDALSGALVAAACRVGVRGSFIAVVEDDPAVSMTAPRGLGARAGMAVVEPWDMASLRDGVDLAWRLCMDRQRCMLVVSSLLLRTRSTVTMRANRLVSSLDQASWLLRRRATRPVEAADALRTARRSEWNRLFSLPSPGEREPVGFVALGACAVPMLHSLAELSLSGRIPLLRLGITEPGDEAMLERIIERCIDLVVVESRPGAFAEQPLRIADRRRAAGLPAARIWTGELPSGEIDGRAVIERLLPGDGLRTSTLVRRVIHLLHQVRPGLRVVDQLAVTPGDSVLLSLPPRGASLGEPAARQAIQLALEWAASEIDSRADAEARYGLRWSNSGDSPHRRSVWVECRSRREFARLSALEVRAVFQGARRSVMVVFDLGGDCDPDPERRARGVLGAEADAELRVQRLDLNDSGALRAAIVAAADSPAATLLIAKDGPPARISPELLERERAGLDQTGFRRLQRAVWPADTACDVREASREARIVQRDRAGWELPREARVERMQAPPGVGFRLRVEPLLEQVEVRRVRPPGLMEGLREVPRLPMPMFRHAECGMWRAHIAAPAGTPPGFAAQVLCEAGRAAGFRVDAISQPEWTAAGRRAWSQVTFSRAPVGPEAGQFSPQIPQGEADLLIGLDQPETARALIVDPELRIAAPTRTAAVVDVPRPERSTDEQATAMLEALPGVLRACCLPNAVHIADFHSQVRRFLLSEGLLELVLLGVAWQRGFVPLPIAALEAALGRIQSNGVARCQEALNLGRLLAEGGIAQGPPDAPAGSPQRQARRISLGGALRGRRSHQRATALRSLIEHTSRATTGLENAADGAEAASDLVLAIERCAIWGGLAHARRYSDMVIRLHAHGGGALSAPAVLAIAEAMLPRDLIYVGLMSVSFEHRRRIRQALGVRTARGDEVERRYLSRIDLTLGHRRWLVDFRTSDWPARVLRLVRSLVPQAWRVSPEARRRQEVVCSAFERAALEGRPGRWVPFARTLHDAAESGRLHSMTADEIAALAPGDMAAGSDPGGLVA